MELKLEKFENKDLLDTYAFMYGSYLGGSMQLKEGEIHPTIYIYEFLIKIVRRYLLISVPSNITAIEKLEKELMETISQSATIPPERIQELVNEMGRKFLDETMKNLNDE